MYMYVCLCIPINQQFIHLIIFVFLQFKRSLSTNQYKQLVEAFNEYNNNSGGYESYRDTLFELFNDATDTSKLMGMMLFLKFEHQSKFDEDIQRKYTE